MIREKLDMLRERSYAYVKSWILIIDRLTILAKDVIDMRDDPSEDSIRVNFPAPESSSPFVIDETFATSVNE
eukprot:scaffold11783_cov120-Cylindrotheca_fusiformis.AAC.12